MSDAILTAQAKPLDLYEGFTNKITGEAFKVLSETQESITFHWTVQPHGYVPLEHIHLNQDEIFHIRSGEARIVIDGRERFAKAGEIVRVPKGKPHIVYNDTAEVLDCIVSFEPSLDTYKFFQCFGGLTIDNDMDKNGKINVLKMLYFTRRMNASCVARPSNIPQALFRFAMSLSYILGKMLGWERDYFRYTSGTENRQFKSIL